MNKLTTILLIAFSLMLAACGSGGGNATPTAAVVTDKWAAKTSNHGLGQLIDQQILTMTNGNLYLYGSRFVSQRYEPVLAKSTDGGATWLTAGVAQLSGSVPTLYGTASATDGVTIVVTGGAVSYQDDASHTPPTYSQQIFFYNSSTNVWTTLSAPTSPFQRTNHAMTYNGSGTFFLSGGAQSYYDTPTSQWRNSIFFSKWKSTDGGLNWTAITPTNLVNETTPLGNTGVYRHCMVASGNTLYILGGKRAPIRTTAGGSIADSSEQVSRTAVDKSIDGGLNWTSVNTSIPEAPVDAACTQIGSTLFSSGGLNSADQVTSMVRKSTDGGVTWTLDASSAVHGFRFTHSMTNRSGKVLVFGGTTAGQPSYKTDVIEFAP